VLVDDASVLTHLAAATYMPMDMILRILFHWRALSRSANFPRVLLPFSLRVAMAVFESSNFSPPKSWRTSTTSRGSWSYDDGMFLAARHQEYIIETTGTGVAILITTTMAAGHLYCQRHEARGISTKGPTNHFVSQQP